MPEKSSELELNDKIEILDINDKDQTVPKIEISQEPVVPHERMVIDDVIKIWKEDPASESLGVPKLHALLKKRNPTWQVSEKRVKQLLKQHGLLNNQQLFTYVGEITSLETPNLELPELVRSQFTKKTGKGLYSKQKIAQGTLIWEEKQFIMVPPIDILKLIHLGKACSYCGQPLKQRSVKNGLTVLSGLDCNVCNEMWCSLECKRLNSKLHGLLKHTIYTGESNNNKNKKFNTSNWNSFEKFCIENQWQALYAVGLIFANQLVDKTELIGSQFNAMAKIRQDIRYKALDSSLGAFDSSAGGALFVQEQQETLWHSAYETFLKVFMKDQLTYDQFMEYLGTYNINNVDNSLFLIQSHLNHNCDPNVDVKFGNSRNEGIKVYAKRDINKNEELTTCYTSPLHTVQQRKRELRVNWGFICNCNKCKEDEKSQQRRKSSLGQQQSHSKKEIKEILSAGKQEEFDIEIPENISGERRKSVRFDEKVIAVNN